MRQPPEKIIAETFAKHGVSATIVTPETLHPKVVTAQEAAVIQARMDRSDEGRVEWCIHRHPSDFPTKFVARPWMIPYIRDRRHQSGMLGAFLTADTLDELRAQIPDWLVMYVPIGITDPTVVEVWRHAPADSANADGNHRVKAVRG